MSIRRSAFILLVLVLTFFLPSPTRAGAQESAGDKVVVYYFHQTVRCSTCLEFEAFSKKALDTYFAKEMANDQVEWHIVNIDLAENKHFVDEFKLFTKALVIEKVHDGKAVAWKNLEDIWIYEGDENGFMGLVRDSISAYL